MTPVERSVEGRDVSLQCRNHVHTVLNVRDYADSHLAHAFNCLSMRARVYRSKVACVFGCKCGPQEDAWFGGDTRSLSHISA